MQNLNKNADQTDVRIRIMNQFFFTYLDVPLIKKKKYKNINIYWNSISRKKTGQYFNALLRKRRYLNGKEYANLIQNSKLYINTLSPMGLVSPRYFECMGSGALILCEESKLYNNIFSDNIYVSFRNDLSDFYEKIVYYIENIKEREKIVEDAYSFVQQNHTWEKRIKTLLSIVENIL